MNELVSFALGHHLQAHRECASVDCSGCFEECKQGARIAVIQEYADQSCAGCGREVLVEIVTRADGTVSTRFSPWHRIWIPCECGAWLCTKRCAIPHFKRKGHGGIGPSTVFAHTGWKSNYE